MYADMLDVKSATSERTLPTQAGPTLRPVVKTESEPAPLAPPVERARRMRAIVGGVMCASALLITFALATSSSNQAAVPADPAAAAPRAADVAPVAPPAPEAVPAPPASALQDALADDAPAEADQDTPAPEDEAEQPAKSKASKPAPRPYRRPATIIRTLPF